MLLFNSVLSKFAVSFLKMLLIFSEISNMNEKFNALLAEKEELLHLMQDKATMYNYKLQNSEAELNKRIKEQIEYEELLKEKEVQVHEYNTKTSEMENKIKIRHEDIVKITDLKDILQKEKTELEQKFEQFKAISETSNEKAREEIKMLKEENIELARIVEENKSGRY